VIQESSSEVRLGYDVCNKRIKKSNYQNRSIKVVTKSLVQKSMRTFMEKGVWSAERSKKEEEKISSFALSSE
jgi:hypothetical protein